MASECNLAFGLCTLRICSTFIISAAHCFSRQLFRNQPAVGPLSSLYAELPLLSASDQLPMMTSIIGLTVQIGCQWQSSTAPPSLLRGLHCDKKYANKMSRYKALVHNRLTGPTASPIETTVPTRIGSCRAVAVSLWRVTRPILSFSPLIRCWGTQNIPSLRLRENPSSSLSRVGSQQRFSG